MLGREHEGPVSPEEKLPKGIVHRFEDGALRVSVASALYGPEAIFRSCYWLSDRCYVYLAQPSPDTIEVTLIAKSGEAAATDELLWHFLNDLVDQHLRVAIQKETASIREMIVAQAFADADLIDDFGRPRSEQPKPPNNDDPVRTWRPVS